MSLKYFSSLKRAEKYRGVMGKILHFFILGIMSGCERDIGRSYPSGCEKRMRTKERESRKKESRKLKNY
jgi:hypothetical protein